MFSSSFERHLIKSLPRSDPSLVWFAFTLNLWEWYKPPLKLQKVEEILARL